VRHDFRHSPAGAQRRLVPAFPGQIGEELRHVAALGRDHVPDVVHRCHVSFSVAAYVTATSGIWLR
jgi:hypothetical protein